MIIDADEGTFKFSYDSFKKRDGGFAKLVCCPVDEKGTQQAVYVDHSSSAFLKIMPMEKFLAEYIRMED